MTLLGTHAQRIDALQCPLLVRTGARHILGIERLKLIQPYHVRVQPEDIGGADVAIRLECPISPGGAELGHSHARAVGGCFHAQIVDSRSLD